MFKLHSLRNGLATLLVLLFSIPVSLQNTHYADENAFPVVQSVTPCHLYGDPDIYGIGIRISFYLTWLTLWVAVALGKKPEIKGTRRGFTIVALAVLINTYISVLNGSFAALEIFLVASLVIILSFYFLVPFGTKRFETVNPFDTESFRDDLIGIGILGLIVAAFLLTQPWLYFIVLRQGSKDICDAKIWIFYPVQLFGSSWIGFLKFVAVAVVPVAFIAIVLAFAAIGFDLFEKPVVKRLRKIRDLEAEIEALRTRPLEILNGLARRGGRGANSARLDMIFVWSIFTLALNILRDVFSLRAALFLVQAFAIAFVEMTIAINNIDLSSAPITATSQLIPLLVGVFSAASVIWISIRPKAEVIWEDARQEAVAQRLDRPFVAFHDASADLRAGRLPAWMTPAPTPAGTTGTRTVVSGSVV